MTGGGGDCRQRFAWQNTTSLGHLIVFCHKLRRSCADLRQVPELVLMIIVLFIFMLWAIAVANGNKADVSICNVTNI